jgi:hypothetical protein
VRLRARLASGVEIHQQATGVPVIVLQKIVNQTARSSQRTRCVLASDGFYCLGEQSNWGARVCIGSQVEGAGDVELAEPPALFANATLVAPGDVAQWLEPELLALPGEGVLLQLRRSITLYVQLPDAERWFAALCLALKAPNVAIHAQ